MGEAAGTDRLKIGNRFFDRHGRTYIMGILNVTPDSFSDGGRWDRLDPALRHVEEMIGDGMDILDVGGESTRPGYTMISPQVEMERVVPVIEAIKSRFDIPVSLDTYKSEVAQAGIAAGADMINDIWGLKFDEDMAAVIARSGLPCCLMHNRRQAAYDRFWEDVAADLKDSLRLAAQAGIAPDKIILDPGVGFAKTYEQNLEILRSLERLHMFGCPLLLGCSRKSVIGITLNLPPDERMEGTLAATVLSVVKGCSFVRVHDVKENSRAVRMAEAILGGALNEQR